jgi:hypothetical protein
MTSESDLIYFADQLKGEKLSLVISTILLTLAQSAVNESLILVAMVAGFEHGAAW